MKFNFPLVTRTNVPIFSNVDWKGRIGTTDEVTLGEAAELLGVAPLEVLGLVETDRLPARTNCSVIRISLADIEILRHTPLDATRSAQANP